MTKRENPADMGPLLLLGGLGLAYYLWSTGYFSSLFGASAASPATSAGTGTSGGTAVPAGSSPTATSQPSYSGPTLDQMFANLLAAEQAAMSASSPDTALTCGGASTAGVVSSRSGVDTGIATNPNLGRTAGRTPAGTQAALSGLGATVCAMPYATYDVHNWYLVNRAGSGIAAAPNPPDHTAVLSLSDYWTWAAPLLKAQVPGLSGGFGRGLGAYAELGQLMRMQRGLRQ